MSESLSLMLRFRPFGRSVSPFEFAALFEDVEALYLAVPEALDADQPVARHLARQQEARIRQMLGSPNALLGEIEYRARALQQLEVAGAPDRALMPLRYALARLAETDVERVAEGPWPKAEKISSGLTLERVSMRSPAEIVLSIPVAYWAASATSLLLFLEAIERRFNMRGRIRTERTELTARRRKAEVETARAERVLEQLRELDVRGEEAPHAEMLDGLQAPEDRPFELEEGELGRTRDAE